jgi:hypothetical protein
MRKFISTPNLKQAVGLAAIITAMSVGRILQAGAVPSLQIPAAFLAMIFVCGAVTAWGTSAGMPGIVTDRKTLVQGTLVAICLSLIALPLQIFWIVPFIYKSLLASAKPSLAALMFPATVGSQIAVLLWSAGFQTMFMQSAPMSFFARLVNRQSIALALCLVFRAYVAHRQLAGAGLAGMEPVLSLSTLLATAAGCLVFARFGLVPTILLSIGLNLHLLLR